MFGSSIAGYFHDRGNEALESNRQLQALLNQNLALRNIKVEEGDKKDDKDGLTVSQFATREAYYDKIQEMIDKRESLKSVSFEDFQIFARDRYNMPMTKEVYNLIEKSSNSREHFDSLLRDVLEKWKSSGNMSKNWTHNAGGNEPVSYATYASNARLVIR